jgi:8-oxo-dGTP pyrophosphatase MutT (NUDIX family)
MAAREVALFLWRRGREVLILQRASALGGFWHVVAGGVESAESWDEAAKRELAEETGLAVDALVPIARTNFTYSLPVDGSAEDVEVECVLIEVADDYEPTLNVEHETYRWCGVREACRMVQWANIADSLQELVASLGRETA